MLPDTSQQTAFDLHVLGDGFDDPVAILQLRQVIVEIADRDARRKLGRGESRRPGLSQPFESLGTKLVGLPGLCHVQQKHREPGVRDVRGDARAHRARAQHGDAADRVSHRLRRMGDSGFRDG